MHFIRTLGCSLTEFKDLESFTKQLTLLLLSSLVKHSKNSEKIS